MSNARARRAESSRGRPLNASPVTQSLSTREPHLERVLIQPRSASWGQGSAGLRAVQIAEKPGPSLKEHLF